MAKYSGMPVISIDDFRIRPIDGARVGVRNTTNLTSINGAIDDRLTSLVVFGKILSL